jgi:3-isopropylmalate/(R)-2-methylmalate dehydratase small subunit
MEKFTTLTGVAAPLPIINVDTDMLIPKQFLKTIKRTGLGKHLFDEMRYTPEGQEKPDFVLNQPEYADASILVAGPDFGTGSSREHANWALLDGGFRVVISPRFADIFRNNSTKAGLLTVVLPEADVEALWAAVEADPTTQVTVDLQAKQVTYGDTTVPFEVDDYVRWRLLEGLDDVGLTERNLDDIEAFEATRPAWLPTALPAR